MWKLFILTFAAANIEGGPIGEIQHPWGWDSQEACEQFKREEWKVRTNKNLIVHDAQCIQTAERI